MVMEGYEVLPKTSKYRNYQYSALRFLPIARCPGPTEVLLLPAKNYKISN